MFGSFGSSGGTSTVFGSSNTGSANLFGAPTSAAPTASGNLFGASSSSGTAFGAATSAGQASGGINLFGSSASAAPTSSGNLFGSSTSAAPASTGNLFGAPTSAAPASANNLFGASTSAAATRPISSTANLTPKTKFVDLPADIQKMLETIERQKQVQIQIGRSIIADETEKELQKISRTVQRLNQELEVAKMTLAADKDCVDDAKKQVNFAVKHAERGASLMAHATDDGTWAQSGLTPLQVANRQKALLAMQSQQQDTAKDNASMLLLGNSGSMQAFNQNAGTTNNASSETKPGGGGSAIDPYESVRRIQFASMHFDVASEYYWAWLTRVETSAQLMAERLDQLERYISAAAPSDVSAQLLQDTDGRPSSKAVSEVIQFQNDSFIAIAGKVAAVDGDLRRLKKRLGLKQ